MSCDLMNIKGLDRHGKGKKGKGKRGGNFISGAWDKGWEIIDRYSSLAAQAKSVEKVSIISPRTTFGEEIAIGIN